MEQIDEKKLNVFAVTYSFPPSPGSGSLRNLKIVKYLPHFNCKVRVLTVLEKYTDNTKSKLLDEIPSEVEVIRTRCFFAQNLIIDIKKKLRPPKNKAKTDKNGSSDNPNVADEQDQADKPFKQKVKDFITDSFAVPDKYVGWFPFALWAGIKSMRREKADIIYAVGKPWTGFFVGLSLKMIFKKPLVIDFMDPWMASIWRPRKAAIIEWILGKLEKIAVKRSNFIIANTGELAKDFIERLNVKTDDCDVITCGFDSVDFEKALPVKKNDCLTITHTGTFYRRRTPKSFLKAVKQLLDDGKISIEDMRINLIGGLLINDPELKALFADDRLKKMIHLQTWVPHDRAIQYLHESDVLLLVQPETHLQIPAKLYEYILIKKTLLTLAQTRGAVGQIIEKEGWGETIEADNETRIAAVLEEYVNAFKNGSLKSTITDESIQNYDYKNLAKKTAEIFNIVSKSKKD